MTRIAAVRGVVPANRYSQAQITESIARMCLLDGTDRRLLDRLHAGAQVRHRNLVLPLEEYAKLDGFGAANDVFIDAATELGTEVVGGALEEAGVAPGDVDMIMFTSVTGIATPSVDARLAGRLGMRPDIKRVPVFGLGCVAGAAGLARVHDYLLGWPDHVAVLVSVELCSLTLQRGDVSSAGMVANALFGDGAAAVVARGDGRRGAGPAVVATRSRLYPDSERVLGWDVRDTGFQIVLDAGLPDIVHAHLADDVRDFLGQHGLTTADVTTWLCHPGGPKVLEAIADALRLPDDALAASWRSLAEVGNLSSASVLHILRDTLALNPQPGTPGLLIAMGPGFSAEFVLLRW